nr:ABC transporter permease [Pseudenhygromyxa sp. WMMC2535]
MRRLATLIRLDAKHALRHKLVHVTVALALLFGALIAFVLPEQLEHQSHDLLLDASEGGRFAALLDAVDPSQVFTQREALREAVAEEPSALGIVFEGSSEAPRATVYVQGNESPERLALIDTGVDAMWRGAAGSPPLPAPTVLDPGAQKPAFDLMFLPILFAVDLCLLGFMFGAVMVLQDKQSGIVALYRVSPGRALDYLLAKLTVNLGLSALNLLILVGVAAPALLLEPRLYAIVLPCCAGMTALGMGLAAFFRDIAQFFYPMAAVGLLAATPMYVVFSPSPGLAWTRWLPSYHALFGAEAVFFTKDAAVIAASTTYSLLFAAAMISLSALALHRRLLSEAP